MITFQEIISASPFTHAEIIGGWKGKGRSFTIVEESITQLDVSTLLLLSNNEETWLQMSEFLSFQNVQGIILYGETLPFIESSIQDFMESQQKPVLFIKTANEYSIKKTIGDLQHLKSMGLYHYVWERSTNDWLKLINEQGLDALVLRLGTWLDVDVFLLDTGFQPHSAINHEFIANFLKDIESLYYRQKVNANESFSMLNHAEHQYLIFPLKNSDYHYGFILIEEKPGMMIDVCIEQVTYALPAIISHLNKENAVAGAHKEYKENFLYNLLYNNIESEQVLIMQGKQWGWDFTQRTQLMVMRLNPIDEKHAKDFNEEKIIRKMQSVISTSFLKSILFPLQGHLVMILFDPVDISPRERKDFMLSLAEKIQTEITKQQPYYLCQIGLGRQYPSNMDLFRSFYEAKVALDMAKYDNRERTVLHFEDIGIGRLLSNIDNHLLHEFYVETLGELIRLDKENEDSYIATLETYYIQNGDINKTADQLFIHANTLRKRLKKIESILHIDLNQYEDSFKLFVALKMMKMLR